LRPILLGFRRAPCARWRAAQRIRHLPLADSIGIDFHKTVSRLYFKFGSFKERDDLALLSRSQEQMPYLLSVRRAPAGHVYARNLAAAWARGGAGQSRCSAKKACVSPSAHRRDDATLREHPKGMRRRACSTATTSAR
jgi:hypothetical protein